MPRVSILAAPRAGLPGVWALGTSPRTGPVDPATNVPTIIPGKNGRFFANGQQEEIVVSDDELKVLQSEPNKSLLAVQVINMDEQPQPEGAVMAQNQPGSTVPPGTTPQPTPAPAPAPPSPGTPTPAPAPAGTPAPAAEPAQPKKASK